MTSSVLTRATGVAGEPAAAGRPRRRRRHDVPWLFTVPALAFYLFVVIVPSVQGAGFAFTDWDGLSQVKHFVGLREFRRLVDDSAATGAIVNTVVIGIGVTVVQNLVGLLLALGVNSRIRSRNVLRVFLFAPAVITSVAVGYLWQNLMTSKGGLNQVLSAVGLGSLQQNWLGNAHIALYSLIGVIVWQFAGYSMVIFLAGLQGVPDELIEAGYIDGAGPVRRFWWIVRPMLAPAITINLMLSIIGGLKLFDQVLVMTGGGPGGATDTMSTLIYKNAFQFNEFSYGIAMALVLTVFVALVSGLQYRLLSRQGR